MNWILLNFKRPGTEFSVYDWHRDTTAAALISDAALF